MTVNDWIVIWLLLVLVGVTARACVNWHRQMRKRQRPAPAPPAPWSGPDYGAGNPTPFLFAEMGFYCGQGHHVTMLVSQWVAPQLLAALVTCPWCQQSDERHAAVAEAARIIEDR